MLEREEAWRKEFFRVEEFRVVPSGKIIVLGWLKEEIKERSEEERERGR